MRHAPLFPAAALLALLLVPVTNAATYYHGSYVAPQPAGYAAGFDGCYWSGAGVYLTQGVPFGDNCVRLPLGAAGRAWSANFNGSVVPPTQWRVCFWSNAPLSCATGGGTIPTGAAWFSFSALDGVAVKWNVTVS